VLLRFCVLALGSLLIGVGVALACAFVLKRLEALGPLQAAAAPSTASVSSSGAAATGPAAASRDSSTSFEIAVVVMGSYFSYLLAETAGMSGIVALFFSSICHSHYSYYSVNSAAQVSGVLPFPQLRCRRRQAGTAGRQPQLSAT
jgi:NhaP-type Na+/H+ or K+/H+ antiporter